MTIVQGLFQLSFLPSEWSALQKGNALLTLLFLIITLVLFLFILFSRFRDGLLYSKKRWLINESQHFITSYMFNEDIEQCQIEPFKEKYLVTNKQRQIFTSELILLRKNIMGEFADRLRQLYLHLGLHIHSKKKLYTSSWSTIADGIKELAEMNMQQDIALIRSFINHPNDELRSVAQVAYLRLQSDTPFSFLDELQSPLLEWQQLQLANAAHKAHMDMPAFKNWLTKSEPSIIIFCIRMIAEYNQHDAVSELIQLLTHPDVSVRSEVIEAICSLEAYEAKESLVELFEQESTEVQIKILEALAVIGDDTLLPFYRKVVESPEKRLQLAATNGIASCSNFGQELLQLTESDLENRLQPVAFNDLRAAL